MNFTTPAATPDTLDETLPDEDLKFFDENTHAWVAERGAFTVYVGSSSADIHGKVQFEY